MKQNDELEKLKQLVLSRYPTFGEELAKINLRINNDLPYHTSGTDGKIIYFDLNYLKNLTELKNYF